MKIRYTMSTLAGNIRGAFRFYGQSTHSQPICCAHSPRVVGSKPALPAKGVGFRRHGDFALCPKSRCVQNACECYLTLLNISERERAKQPRNPVGIVITNTTENGGMRILTRRERRCEDITQITATVLLLVCEQNMSRIRKLFAPEKGVTWKTTVKQCVNQYGVLARRILTATDRSLMNITERTARKIGKGTVFIVHFIPILAGLLISAVWHENARFLQHSRPKIGIAP